MREHRNPRPRLPKPPTPDNHAPLTVEKLTWFHGRTRYLHDRF